MLPFVWCAAIIAALVLYFRQIYSKFSRRGVKNLTPLPVVGNMGRVVLRKEHWAESVIRIYSAFPKERFVGSYEFSSPMLIVRDLELVKRITVKDFEHFLDHRKLIDFADDDLFGRHLLSLRGQEWKDMRSTLSPAFTSSKIRLMLPFMEEVGEQMRKSLEGKIKASASNYIDVDAKDLTTRYANDVIASCAFAIKVDSHADEHNEFYEMGKSTSNFKFLQIIKLFLLASFPKLMSKVKVEIFSVTYKNFFRNLVLGSMQDREARNIIRPDMIHLLMEAKKGKLSHDDKTTVDADAGFATVEESDVGKKKTNREWSDNDLVAQALLFFLAGFDTVSTAMSFLLHELAVNPDVQERLVQEIKENDARNGGKLDYNAVQHLPYLDMVISELLRLWPPALFTDRQCTKDYNLGKPNDGGTEDYIIRKGESITVPIIAIHRNPEYFPDPLKFDPERFSEQNKHNIKPLTYMPFGLGPRNCIGSRFALCEVKVMLYNLLQKMEMSPAAKTQIPAQLCNETFQMKMKGGHWVRFRVRE